MWVMRDTLNIRESNCGDQPAISFLTLCLLRFQLRQSARDLNCQSSKMAKSNKKKQRPRSTLPQVNAPMQHTPRTIHDALSRGVSPAMGSSAKLFRQENQGPSAAAQQANASTAMGASLASTPDRNSAGANTTPDCNNAGADATQECGVMNTSQQDADSLLLSELASQTPQFAANLMSQFSPMLSQGETPSGMNTLPSVNAPGISGATDDGADLLNDQPAMTNDSDLLLVGDLIPMPSPR